MNQPIVTEENTSKDNLPNIDFKALGEGIIEGGADIIRNHFNVGIESTFDNVVESVYQQFNKPNMYIDLFEVDCSYPKVKFYFEIHAPSGKQALPSPKMLLLGNIKEISGTTVKSNKPRKDNFISRKKEYFRRLMGPDTVCRGVITVSELSGEPIIVGYSVTSRINWHEGFEFLARLNRFNKNYKMFGTGLLVERKKKINNTLNLETLLSVGEHAYTISFGFYLNNRPHNDIKDLALDYGLIVYASNPLIDDSITIYTKDEKVGVNCHEKNKVTEGKPIFSGLNIGTELHGDNIIKLDDEHFEKNKYRVCLDFGNHRLASFFIKILDYLNERGAVTYEKGSYDKMFLKSSDSVVGVSFPGLGPLDKDTYWCGTRTPFKYYGKP